MVCCLGHSVNAACNKVLKKRSIECLSVMCLRGVHDEFASWSVDTYSYSFYASRNILLVHKLKERKNSFDAYNRCCGC
jgi:hypothetical protein